MKYFATFISGTQEIIEKILLERDRDLKILALLDGAVVFETCIAYDSLNFFCFNNIFLLLHKKITSNSNNVLNILIKDILRQFDRLELSNPNPKFRTFRVVASIENKLVAVDNNLKSKLESALCRATGLTLNKSNSDMEFWLLYRSEGVAYFLKRLSKHTAYDKILKKGELHPELAYMMCKLSNPKHSDIVLDPFCGYGAIPFQRTKRFPFMQMIAFDINDEAITATKNKFKGRIPKGVVIKKLDIACIGKHLRTESVDAIITDPPWGIYEELKVSIYEFYECFMQSLTSLLKVGGRMVLLTAKKEEFNQLIRCFPELDLLETYNILVSGKKSSIYVIRKCKSKV